MVQIPSPDPAEIEEPQPPSEPPAPPPAGRSAQLVAVGILLSRISGLLRDIVFARFFGSGRYADVFRASLRLPNVLQNLLGEGTLSASFIPVYAELLEKGHHKEAGRVAGAIFALLVGLAGLLALFGIVLAPVLVSLAYPGFTGEKRDLTILCTRIIFPMTGVLVLSAWTLGVLNAHRRFFLPYVAPVLWNVAMITTLVAFGPGRELNSLVIWLAWGAFIGGTLQFLVQLPRVLRLERDLKIRLKLKHPAVQKVIHNATPAIAGRGVVQLSGWADQFFASLMGDGAVARLAYAQNLYMLPVSLFGMSVAAAELPELARSRGAATEKLALRINAGLQQIAVLVVPSTIGYLLLPDIIVGGIYQRGRFDSAETLLVALILAAYTIGLLASTATRLFSSAFFALHDTRTPARIAYVRVGFSAVLAGLITLWVRYGNPAHVRYGPVGLAAVSGLAAWIEWSLLRRRLHARLPGVGLGRKLLVQLLIIAGAAALFARGLEFVLPEWNPLLVAAVVVPPYALIYLVTVHLLGIEARIPLIGRFLPKRK